MTCLGKQHAAEQSPKRKAIIRALEKAFHNRRYDEVTLDEVARIACVGKGTIYLHFKDKEDLFLQMVKESLSEQTEMVRKTAESSLPFRAKLIQAANDISRIFLKHHGAIRLTHSPEFAKKQPGAQAMMREHFEQLDGILKSLFREGERSGRMKTGLDMNQALCVFRGMLMARNFRLVMGLPETAIEGLVDIFLNGVAPAEKHEPEKGCVL